MKKYDSYKDSGVEWIGDIPTNWNLIPIKFLVSTKVTDGPHETPEFLDEGIPFLSVESVQDNKLDFNKKRGYISKELHEVYSQKCKPQRDDIFIVKSGSTTGKSTIVETDIDFNIWSPICIVRPKKEIIYPKFTSLSIQSFYFRRFVELGWSFGTQPNIGMGVIENIRLIVPPLPEQLQIVNYLDEKTSIIDNLIDKTQQKIGTLKELRSSLINQVVTKGLDPSVEMKDSGVEWIGEIPKHWEITPLNFLGNFQNGVSKGSEYFGTGYPFMNYGDVYKNETTPEMVEGKVESTDIDRERYSVLRGDVFFTRTSESKDDIGISSICLKTISECVFSGFVIRFRFYDETHLPEFSRYHFQTHWKKVFIESKMNIVTRSSLSQQVLGQVPVLIPPIEEQNLIVDYLNEQTLLIDTSIQKEQLRIEKLKDFRQSLISDVVTGKIKVCN